MNAYIHDVHQVTSGPWARIYLFSNHEYVVWTGHVHVPDSWARICRRIFSKRCIFGSKSDNKFLVRRYLAKFAKTVPEHLKVWHIWLIQFFNKIELCE